jgi:uncharacterized protein YoaH (UPF0181 family)
MTRHKSGDKPVPQTNSIATDVLRVAGTPDGRRRLALMVGAIADSITVAPAMWAHLSAVIGGTHKRGGRPKINDRDAVHQIRALMRRGVPRGTAISFVARNVGVGETEKRRWRDRLNEPE